MAWVAANWFWVLIFIAFIAMHLYAGLVFVPIYNCLARRWGVPEDSSYASGRP